MDFHYLEALSMAVAALLVLLSSLLLYVFWISPLRLQSKLRANGFVGPRPSFPLGNIKEMSTRRSRTSSSPTMGSLDISHDIHSTVFPYFAQWRESYGKVFLYWLGTEPFLYIADPEFLKQATSGVLAKRWGKPDVFKHDRKPMFGNGLVMVEGDDWTHHRNIISPAFSATNLNAMIIDMMVESTIKMIDGWIVLLSKSSDQEIDIKKHVLANAAEIIAKISFGISHEKGKKVYEKLMAMQIVLFGTNRMVGVPFGKLFHLKQTMEAAALGKEIDQLLLSTINSRREDGSGPQHDLLGLLLASNQENAQSERKLTEGELVDECKTLFFAGHETTALALTWTLLLLAMYPEWQRILRDEVMEVFGEGTIDSTMLTKLKKMEWVLKEVLRLYSPAPNVQRQTRDDIRIGEKIIPKGTNMWVDVVGMHHDPELWGDDVNEFKPERFKDSDGGCKHRMGFLPFGFGGRMCVGRNLTKFEYKIVLSLILRRFTMSVSPKYVHSPSIMLTLRPSLAVPLLLQPINS